MRPQRFTATSRDRVPPLDEDSRHIQSILTAGDRGSLLYVPKTPRPDFLAENEREFSSIKAYEEPGQGAYVPWFALERDGRVVKRINGAHVVEVTYFEEVLVCPDCREILPNGTPKCPDCGSDTLIGRR